MPSSWVPPLRVNVQPEVLKNLESLYKNVGNSIGRAIRFLAGGGTRVGTANSTSQYVLQYGNGTIAASAITLAVNFPQAFPNGVAVVLTTPSNVGTTVGWGIKVNSVTQSGFTASTGGTIAEAWPFDWVAIGW